MGRLRALRLGITKGISHAEETGLSTDSPICPKEHDAESLARLLGKSKSWRMAKKTAMMASKMIGQPGPEGLDDIVLWNALKEHDKECVTGPESKWCRCDWCNQRRRAVSGND